MTKPESITILDNYTVIAPLSWLSTKRAAEDTNEEFLALIRWREKLLRGSVLRARPHDNGQTAWLHEVKLDGYRCFCREGFKRVTL